MEQCIEDSVADETTIASFVVKNLNREYFVDRANTCHRNNADWRYMLYPYSLFSIKIRGKKIGT